AAREVRPHRPPLFRRAHPPAPRRSRRPSAADYSTWVHVRRLTAMLSVDGLTRYSVAILSSRSPLARRRLASRTIASVSRAWPLPVPARWLDAYPRKHSSEHVTDRARFVGAGA